VPSPKRGAQQLALVQLGGFEVLRAPGTNTPNNIDLTDIRRGISSNEDVMEELDGFHEQKCGVVAKLSYISKFRILFDEMYVGQSPN